MGLGTTPGALLEAWVTAVHTSFCGALMDLASGKGDREVSGLGRTVPSKGNVSNDPCQQEGGNHHYNPLACCRHWQKDLGAWTAKPTLQMCGDTSTVMPAGLVPAGDQPTLSVAGLCVALPTHVPQCYGPWV